MASTPSEPSGHRPENKYAQVSCNSSGNARCVDLNPWAKGWEDWGRTLLKELDEMKLAICNLEKKVYYGVEIPQKGTICDSRGPIQGNGGGPPTDTGQPPKPPFK